MYTRNATNGDPLSCRLAKSKIHADGTLFYEFFCRSILAIFRHSRAYTYAFAFRSDFISHSLFLVLSNLSNDLFTQMPDSLDSIETISSSQKRL